jgi:thymidylate synthase
MKEFVVFELDSNFSCNECKEDVKSPYPDSILITNLKDKDVRKNKYTSSLVYLWKNKTFPVPGYSLLRPFIVSQSIDAISLYLKIPFGLPPDSVPSVTCQAIKTTDDYILFECHSCNPNQSDVSQIIREVKTRGVESDDRTGVGIIKLFGELKLVFDLSEGFPIVTQRRGFFRGIFEELMWFLRGQTDSKILEAKGVNVWKGNSSRAYLDSIKLTHLREGDCGPIYGFNWRHWGCKYETCETDYTGKGKDQLMNLISELKSNPNSRRLILSGWNVSDLSEMSLPPCHTMYQFDVTQGKLNCLLFQRSNDLMLAGHWNVSSASLLITLLASVTGLQPGKLIMSYGNAHIYKNHLSAYEEMTRPPFPFPKLILKNTREKITDYSFEDVQLENYLYYPEASESLKLQMNA